MFGIDPEKFAISFIKDHARLKGFIVAIDGFLKKCADPALQAKIPAEFASDMKNLAQYEPDVAALLAKVS